MAARGDPLRTLNRRLAEQGTRVRAPCHEVRRDTACQLLAQTAKTAGEVGQLLGYSEAAAFTRALRHWTGPAPGQWRAQPPSPLVAVRA